MNNINNNNNNGHEYEEEKVQDMNRLFDSRYESRKLTGLNSTKLEKTKSRNSLTGANNKEVNLDDVQIDIQQDSTMAPNRNSKYQDISQLSPENSMRKPKKQRKNSAEIRRQKQIDEEFLRNKRWVQLEVINRRLDPLRATRIIIKEKEWCYYFSKEELLSLVLNIFFQEQEIYNITDDKTEIHYLKEQQKLIKECEIRELEFHHNIMRTIIKQYPKNWENNYTQFNFKSEQNKEDIKRKSVKHNTKIQRELGKILSMAESQMFTDKCLKCSTMIQKENKNLLEVSVRCDHCYCQSCLEKYLQNQLESIEYQDILKIKCPYLSCDEYIKQDVVVKNLKQDKLRTQYFYKRFQLQMLKQNYIIECPDCETLIRNYPSRKQSQFSDAEPEHFQPQSSNEDSLQLQLALIQQFSSKRESKDDEINFEKPATSDRRRSKRLSDIQLEQSYTNQEDIGNGIKNSKRQQDNKLQNYFGEISEIQQAEQKDKVVIQDKQLKIDNQSSHRNRKITEYQSEYEQDNDNEDNPQKQFNRIDYESFYNQSNMQLKNQKIKDLNDIEINGGKQGGSRNKKRSKSREKSQFSQMFSTMMQSQKQSNKNFIICLNCNKKICQDCQRPEHSFQQCSGILEEELENRFKELQFINCPKCQVKVNALYGIKRIKCHECNYIFCGYHQHSANAQWGPEHDQCPSYFDQIYQKKLEYKTKEEVYIKFTLKDDDKLAFYQNGIFQFQVNTIFYNIKNKEIQLNRHDTHKINDEDEERIIAILRYMTRISKVKFYVDKQDQKISTKDDILGIKILYAFKWVIAFILMPPVIMWIIGEGVALRCCCNPYSKTSDCKACTGKLVQFVTFVFLLLILISNYIIVLPILYIFSAMYIYVNPLKVKIYIDDVCGCCNPLQELDKDIFKQLLELEKEEPNLHKKNENTENDNKDKDKEKDKESQTNSKSKGKNNTSTQNISFNASTNHINTSKVKTQQHLNVHFDQPSPSTQNNSTRNIKIS